MRKLIAALMLAAAISPVAAAEITLNKTVIGCLDPAVLLDPAAATQLAEQHQMAAIAAANNDDTDFMKPEFHRCRYFSGPDTSRFGPFRYWSSNLPPPSVLAGKNVIDLGGTRLAPYWVILRGDELP